MDPRLKTIRAMFGFTTRLVVASRRLPRPNLLLRHLRSSSSSPPADVANDEVGLMTQAQTAKRERMLAAEKKQQRREYQRVKGYLTAEEADDIFRRLRRKEPDGKDVDDVDVRNLSRYLGYRGELETFGAFFEALEAERIVPTVQNYVDFMTACLKGGAPGEVMNVFKHFKSSNLKPNNRIVQLLLRVAGSANDPDIVSDILDLCHQRGLSFDRTTYNTLLKVSSETQGLSACLDWFETMRRNEVDPNADSYSLLIRACIQEGKIHDADKLLAAMKGKTLRPTNVAYSAYLRFFCARGDFDSADRVIQDMEQGGVKAGPDVYNAVISAHIRHGNLRKALDVFYAMRSQGLKLSATDYNVLLNAVGHLDDKQLMAGVLTSMKDHGPSPDSFTYATLITKYGAVNKHNEALAAFFEMRRRKLADTVGYNAIIQVCLRGKRPHEKDALRLLKEMEQAGIPPNEVTYTSFIHYYGQVKKPELAIHMLQQMEAEELKPGVIEYTALIQALQHAGDYSKAIAYFHRLKRKGIQPNAMTYTALVTAHCKNQEPEEAYAVLEEMQQEGISPSVHIYHRLMLTEGKLGNVHKSLKLFADLKRVQIEPNMAIYRCLLQTCIAHNDVGEAKLLMQEMEQRRLSPPHWAILGLLRCYAWDGNTKQVLSTLREVVRRRLPMSGAVKESVKLISFDLSKNKALHEAVQSQIKLIQEHSAPASPSSRKDAHL